MAAIQSLIAEEATLNAAEGDTQPWFRQLTQLAIDEPILIAHWYQQLRDEVRTHRQNLNWALRGLSASEFQARDDARSLRAISHIELSVRVPMLRAVKALHDAALSHPNEELIRRKAEHVGMMVLGPIALGHRFLGKSLPYFRLEQRRVALDCWKSAALPLALPAWVDSLMRADPHGTGLNRTCLFIDQKKRAQEYQVFRKRILDAIEGKISEADFERLKQRI